MKRVYICDRSNYVRFGNDKIHSCGRHDVLTAEGTCCPGTLQRVFYASDLEKEIQERKQQIKNHAVELVFDNQLIKELEWVESLLQTIQGEE